jgi:hypothetical protein
VGRFKSYAWINQGEVVTLIQLLYTVSSRGNFQLARFVSTSGVSLARLMFFRRSKPSAISEYSIPVGGKPLITFVSQNSLQVQKVPPVVDGKSGGNGQSDSTDHVKRSV